MQSDTNTVGAEQTTAPHSEADNKQLTTIKSRHAQVPIPTPFWHNDLVAIDRNIAPLIQALWQLDMCTRSSCENNGEGMIWISFHDSADAQQFLTIVAQAADKQPGVEDYLYMRLLQWNDGTYDTHRPHWRCEAVFEDYGGYVKSDKPIRVNIEITISVRFPIQDYEFVLKTVQDELSCRRFGDDAVRRREEPSAAATLSLLNEE